MSELERRPSVTTDRTDEGRGDSRPSEVGSRPTCQDPGCGSPSVRILPRSGPPVLVWCPRGTLGTSLLTRRRVDPLLDRDRPRGETGSPPSSPVTPGSERPRQREGDNDEMPPPSPKSLVPVRHPSTPSTEPPKSPPGFGSTVRTTELLDPTPRAMGAEGPSVMGYPLGKGVDRCHGAWGDDEREESLTT